VRFVVIFVGAVCRTGVVNLLSVGPAIQGCSSVAASVVFDRSVYIRPSILSMCIWIEMEDKMAVCGCTTVLRGSRV
jgi:hypothetical protein